MLEAILSVLSLVVGWLIKSYPEWRKQWRQVKLAQAELDHPMGTNDPEVAAQNALLSVERKRVRDTVRRLMAPSIHRAGSQSDSNGDGHKTPPYGVRKG